MKKSEYRRERNKLAAQQAELQGALDGVVKRVAALDLVWSEVFNSGSADTAYDNDSTASGGDQANVQHNGAQHVVTANGHTGEYVVAAVKTFDSVFGVREVIEQIQAAHSAVSVNRSTVASKLSQLAEDGLLSVVEPGRGRRPGSFKRVSA